MNKSKDQNIQELYCIVETEECSNGHVFSTLSHNFLNVKAIYKNLRKAVKALKDQGYVYSFSRAKKFGEYADRYYLHPRNDYILFIEKKEVLDE